MRYIDYFTAQNLAVFALAFLGGLISSFLFKRKGLGGCLTTILAAIVVTVIIVALIKGYSPFIENMTFYLTEYIYYNSLGVVGFVFGLLMGFLLRKRSS